MKKHKERWRIVCVMVSTALFQIGSSTMTLKIWLEGSSKEHTICAPIMAIAAMGLFGASMFGIKETKVQQISIAVGLCFQLAYILTILYFR